MSKKLAKKAVKKLETKKQEVEFVTETVTEELLEQNPRLVEQGLEVGDQIDVVVGVKDDNSVDTFVENVENDQPEPVKQEVLMHENKKVSKVEKHVLNGIEYNKITTEDMCTYLVRID